MLLDSIGKHVQLNKTIDGDEMILFPVNTIEDIIIDEDGNELTNYLPTVSSDGVAVGSPLSAKEIGTLTMEDAVYNALIG